MFALVLALALALSGLETLAFRPTSSRGTPKSSAATKEIGPPKTPRLAAVPPSPAEGWWCSRYFPHLLSPVTAALQHGCGSDDAHRMAGRGWSGLSLTWIAVEFIACYVPQVLAGGAAMVVSGLAKRPSWVSVGCGRWFHSREVIR
ncbi:hypothetical protein F5884DRAFT_744808 [Xylogone sp. PMI_703]|nr:hypothetical protein F5884DRAFT_744808 [Xylogone sp. PMI_703]